MNHTIVVVKHPSDGKSEKLYIDPVRWTYTFKLDEDLLLPVRVNRLFPFNLFGSPAKTPEPAADQILRAMRGAPHSVNGPAKQKIREAARVATERLFRDFRV